MNSVSGGELLRYAIPMFIFSIVGAIILTPIYLGKLVFDAILYLGGDRLVYNFKAIFMTLSHFADDHLVLYLVFMVILLVVGYFLWDIVNVVLVNGILGVFFYSIVPETKVLVAFLLTGLISGIAYRDKQKYDYEVQKNHPYHVIRLIFSTAVWAVIVSAAFINIKPTNFQEIIYGAAIVISASVSCACFQSCTFKNIKCVTRRIIIDRLPMGKAISIVLCLVRVVPFIPFIVNGIITIKNCAEPTADGHVPGLNENLFMSAILFGLMILINAVVQIVSIVKERPREIYA